MQFVDIEERSLGDTGHETSVLTFDASTLEPTPQGEADSILEQTLSLDVDHIYVPPGGDGAEKLEPTLGDRRDEILLSVGIRATTATGALTALKESMDRLGVDGVDVCHIRVEDRADLDAIVEPGGALDGLRDAGDDGLLDDLGVVTDAPAAVVTEVIDRVDPAVLTLPINYRTVSGDEWGADEPDYRPVLEQADEAGVGIVGTETFAKGPWPPEEELPERLRPYETAYMPFDGRLFDCLDFALSQPVSTVTNVGDPWMVNKSLYSAVNFEPMDADEQREFVDAGYSEEPTILEDTRIEEWMDDEVDPDFEHAPDAAVEDWRDLKFGMRVHWGTYSVLGLDASTPLAGASEEFKTVYRTLYQMFNPTEFDGEEWADFAEASGFKYGILTTSHAEGFAMWPTDTTVEHVRRKPVLFQDGIGTLEKCEISYDVMDAPIETDIVGELADAFGDRELELGLYYAHGDWNDPNQRGINDNHIDYDPEFTRESNPEAYREAHERKKTQLDEITSRYGDLLMLSYDGGSGPEMWEETKEIVKMVRENQPEALFRWRGLGPYGDYQTPEHYMPAGPDDPRLTKPWQAIEQLGTRWAYQPNDHYHSREWILDTLIEAVAKGGNFMLGISPMPNGRFPPEVVEKCEWVGEWLDTNGEAVYGTRPVDATSDRSDLWFTGRNGGETVYAVVEGWPGEAVAVPDVDPADDADVTMLGDDTPLPWENQEDGIRVSLPERLQDARDRPCEFAYAFEIGGTPANQV